MNVEIVKGHSLRIFAPDEQTIMDATFRVTPYTWEGRVDDEVVCILGCVPPTLMADYVYVWLYVTPEVDKHKFIFLRYSQRLVEELLKIWPKIIGHSYVNDARAHRWLKWLGAEFDYPKDGRVSFTIRRK